MNIMNINAAINIISKHMNTICDEDVFSQLNDVLYVLGQCKREQSFSNWISVEEELPKFGDYVQVYTNDNYFCPYRYGYFFKEYEDLTDKGDISFCVNGVENNKELYKDITHWQQLPPAPEEK